MIYSTQFFQGQIASGATTLLTVPSGHVYVVRDIAITPFPSGDPDGVLVYIGGTAGGILLGSEMIPAGETLHEVGNWVIPPGQTLNARSDGRTYRLIISGYDLINY